MEFFHTRKFWHLPRCLEQNKTCENSILPQMGATNYSEYVINILSCKITFFSLCLFPPGNILFQPLLINHLHLILLLPPNLVSKHPNWWRAMAILNLWRFRRRIKYNTGRRWYIPSLGLTDMHLNIPSIVFGISLRDIIIQEQAFFGPKRFHNIRFLLAD